MSERSARRDSRRRTLAAALRAGRYGVAVLAALVFLFPSAAAVLRSLEGTADTGLPLQQILGRLMFENYTTVLGLGAGLARWVVNTLAVAAITMLGSSVIATMAGFALARIPFRFSKAVFMLLLTQIMIPYQTILAPLFLVLTKLHLTDSLFGLALVYVVFHLPFSVFVMRTTFSAIPLEIEEAAIMDGASTASLLRTVMIPLATPGIVTVVLYAFILAWNEFLAALLLMSQEEHFTIAVALNNVETGLYGGVNFGLLEAGAVIAMLPSILVFVLLQRYYTAGLLVGSVKA